MTWNAVRGCTEVSPGCALCYARIFAERFRGVKGHPYEFGFDLRLVPEKLLEPFSKIKPQRIFVNSMSDLFHEGIPDEYIGAVTTVMMMTPWHQYQVLTKRSERMRDMLNGPLAEAARMPHICWGVSVENRRHGLPRIEHLRRTPAAVKMLSIEPLLEDLGSVDYSGIHWAIVGGESGAGSHLMLPEWARSIRDQCYEQGVLFFFKQWGGFHAKEGGRELDGRTHNDMPPLPGVRVPNRRCRRELIDRYREMFGHLGLDRKPPEVSTALPIVELSSLFGLPSPGPTTSPDVASEVPGVSYRDDNPPAVQG